MLRFTYHPKAFLAHKKNVQRGLVSRTKVVSLLHDASMNARALAEKTGLSYKSVLYHLHLLENERIIVRNDTKPYIWSLTGAGQQTLLGR